MKFTPLPGVLCLSIPLLCLWQGTGCLFLVPCFAGQGFPFLASRISVQVQSLACAFVEISPRFWQHTDRNIQVKIFRGSPSQFGCINVDHCDISESSVTWSPWYSALYTRYEICWCTPTPSCPSLNIEWSIWCTGHHSFPQGNIVPWRHLWKRLKWNFRKHSRIF